MELKPKVGAAISHDVGAEPDAIVARAIQALDGGHYVVRDEKGVYHEVAHVGTLGVPAHLVCRVRH